MATEGNSKIAKIVCNKVKNVNKKINGHILFKCKLERGKLAKKRPNAIFCRSQAIAKVGKVLLMTT